MLRKIGFPHRLSTVDAGKPPRNPMAMQISSVTLRTIALSILGLGIVGYIAANQLEDGTLSQSGRFDSSNDMRIVSVYYPIPFATEPNLQVQGEFVYGSLKQSATGFELGITIIFGERVTGRWEAIGAPDPELDPRPYFR